MLQEFASFFHLAIDEETQGYEPHRKARPIKTSKARLRAASPPLNLSCCVAAIPRPTWRLKAGGTGQTSIQQARLLAVRRRQASEEAKQFCIKQAVLSPSREELERSSSFKPVASH